MAILPLISTLFIVISATFVAVGWYFIKIRKIKTHKRMMVIAAIFAVLFLLIYLLRTLIIGNTSFGGPDNIKPLYRTFLIFHIVLAISGLVLGIVTINLSIKGRYIKHRRLGPFSAVIWFCSTITGVLVYLFLYVIWDPGPTTSMFKAILGV